MNDSPKLILLSDIIESKVRKERELDFYQKELEKLQEKMYWLRREIGLNETIIDIIKKDNVIDFKEQMEKKLLEE
jgi:hypothetical protein